MATLMTELVSKIEAEIYHSPEDQEQQEISNKREKCI